MLSDRSNQSNQPDASVEPVDSRGMEVVAPASIPEYVNELVTRAKHAAGRLAMFSTAVKDRALLAMAEALEAQKDAVLAANELDLEAFGTAPEKKAMADRLRLTEKRIVEMAAGLREVAALPDPGEAGNGARHEAALPDHGYQHRRGWLCRDLAPDHA